MLKNLILSYWFAILTHPKWNNYREKLVFTCILCIQQNLILPALQVCIHIYSSGCEEKVRDWQLYHPNQFARSTLTTTEVCNSQDFLCSLLNHVFFSYVLVIARYQLQCDKYFPSFSYFAIYFTSFRQVTTNQAIR